MRDVLPFAFEDNPLRVLPDQGDGPWFIAKDVAEALNYRWNGTGTIAHVPECWRGVRSVPTLSGEQPMAVLSEQGLYFFLGRSDKPRALPLQMYVAGQVLPSIRRTGSFGPARDAMEMLKDPAVLRDLLLSYTGEVTELKGRVAALAPKAEAMDRLVETAGSMCVTDAAKTLQIPPRELFGFLRAHGWTYARTDGSGHVGYQAKINAGLLEHKVRTVPRAGGGEKTVTQVRVTSKGLSALAVALRNYQHSE